MTVRNSLNYALDLWRRGLSVIPVPRPDGRRYDGKVPTITWRDFQSRRATEVEIRVMFASDTNVAVVTGTISAVVVIDADSREALRWCTRRLPYTPWQTETARGFHLWYRHPGVRVPNRVGLETGDGRLAIDVRGDGGYVIAPGSVHASGTVYEYAGDWSVPRDRLPRLWLGWLRRSERPVPRRPTTRQTGALTDRARRYLAAIPCPHVGNGSDTATFYAACRLVRGFGLSDADAVSLLWEWAGRRDGWTRDWIARKVQCAFRYGTEPIGGLVS